MTVLLVDECCTVAQAVLVVAPRGASIWYHVAPQAAEWLLRYKLMHKACPLAKNTALLFADMRGSYVVAVECADRMGLFPCSINIGVQLWHQHDATALHTAANSPQHNKA